jgi:hypothetical protein
MALMLGSLREALVEAGASEAKASKAAEEVAAYDRDIATIKAELVFHRWAFGIIIALQIATLMKVLFP